MNQSNLEMQAQLQQTLANQAREQNKMMLNQQEFNKQMVDSQSNFFKMTSESIQSILSSIPTMMRQYAIEAQTFNPALLSAVAPQLMLTVANSALAPSTSLTPPKDVVLSPAPSGVTASVQVPENVPSTSQSSDLGSRPELSNVQEAAQVQENRQAPQSSAS